MTEKPEKTNKKSIKNSRGGTLYPGYNGQKNGRPKKIPALEALLDKYMTEEKDGLAAMDAVIMQLRNKAIKGDMKAIEYLLNRAYGKPKESIDVKQETNLSGSLDLTPERARDLIQKLDSEEP